MDTTNSLVDFTEGSPSQGQIGHNSPIKRDYESLDDFEHITKDSPTKDSTAQFISYESGSVHRPKQQQSDIDDILGFSDDKSNELNREPEPKMDIFSESPPPYSKDDDDDDDDDLMPRSDNIGSSKNFLHYEQTTVTNPSKDDLLDFIQNEQDNKNVDNKKLLDVDSSDEDEDQSGNIDVIPTKPIVKKRPSADDLLFEDDIKLEPDLKPEDKPKTTPVIAEVLIPEPVIPAPKPVIPTPKEPEHGDGLHVKEVEVEPSDNEEAAPELPAKDYPEIGAIEAEVLFSGMGLNSWFDPKKLNPKVEALIYWRDPKKSGIVFSSILAVLLSLTAFSLISVIAYTSLIVLVAAISFRIYKNVLQAVQKTSEGHPFKNLNTVLNHPIISKVFLTIKEYLELDLTLNPDKVREFTDLAVVHINSAIAELRRRFLVEDLIDSIKFGVLLWCLTYVGAWFNGLSLIIIAFVGLFTLPKGYENNKTQIDANIAVVKAKINEVTEKLKAIIPIGKKPEEAKDKDE